MDRIALMFDDSGLAGVLLGEEHFPALEKRKIKSILLTDKRAVHTAGAQRALHSRRRARDGDPRILP